MAERKDRSTQDKNSRPNDKEFRKSLNEDTIFHSQLPRTSGPGSISYIAPSPFEDFEMKPGDNKGV